MSMFQFQKDILSVFLKLLKYFICHLQSCGIFQDLHQLYQKMIFFHIYQEKNSVLQFIF